MPLAQSVKRIGEAGTSPPMSGGRSSGNRPGPENAVVPLELFERPPPPALEMAGSFSSLGDLHDDVCLDPRDEEPLVRFDAGPRECVWEHALPDGADQGAELESEFLPHLSSGRHFERLPVVHSAARRVPHEHAVVGVLRRDEQDPRVLVDQDHSG